jgi:glycosyltransferase involved in cell wall biosynthesis
VTRLVVVTSGFPRLSETFALNELVALRERGMLAAVVATKPGTWSSVQPQVERLRDLVRVLPPGTVQQQSDTLVEWLRPGPPVTAVHGYFAHEPAAVAAAAARRLCVPYGFSAHALDIRKVPAPEMARRAGTARTVITCNSESARQLRAAGAEPLLLPHGVDVTRFCPATPAARAASRGGAGPRRVLAVGRLVEKKGLDVLVAAFARLRPGRAVLRIVGTGPQEPLLRELVAAHGLGDVVELVGARTHAELPGEFRAADVVVVPSVVDTSGDQDGLPNVVLEAMACGVAVVASDVAAVADAVEHGSTGVLVPPGDAVALAEALTGVLDDDVRRRRLGVAARARILRRYDLATCTRTLCDHLEATYA